MSDAAPPSARAAGYIPGGEEAEIMREAKREQLIDPVCGMRMEPEAAPAVTSYAGRSYYFCSDTHREEFERNPAYYAEKAHIEETGER